MPAPSLLTSMYASIQPYTNGGIMAEVQQLLETIRKLILSVGIIILHRNSLLYMLYTTHDQVLKIYKCM